MNFKEIVPPPIPVTLS
uniref:Uncharacterized protein n=1 Tax=Anguilla anguilla TaxID=7936 RepID=A0A0E9TE54_ANGAN